MFLTVAGRKIYYEKIGEGSRVIVMFHGWGGSRASLRPLAMELQPNCTCYLFDLPGFGESDMPGAEWGIEEYAGAIAEVMSNIQYKISNTDNKNSKFVLLGHSFGGSIALAIAAKHPELISHLVVIAPSWHRKQQRKRPLLHKFAQIPLLKQIGYKLFFPQSDLLMRPDLESNFRKITDQDLTEVVRTVRTPTLILTGDQDTYVPVADSQSLHDLIPHSTLKIYAGSRHALPLEESARIAPDIKHFAVS